VTRNAGLDCAAESRCARACVGQVVRVLKITEHAVTHVCTGRDFASFLSPFRQMAVVSAAVHDRRNTLVVAFEFPAKVRQMVQRLAPATRALL
jgi:hypothetical protein